MKAQSMNIVLNEMKFYSFHGVLPQENTVGAVYRVSLNLETDFSEAAATDNLEGTINYAEVHEAVKEEMSIPVKLLEHLAYRISKRLFADFPTIKSIEITIFKENPPMGADCKDVGIKVKYFR
ncbi:dihydroneopterin aldolase [Bacteroides caecigallinarum]|uniref:7,8-dihydroneopterin aldolase n=1 Tax=Candidatus Phocaeicola faecigallinarum TaxID=2838732 RepID=A0A948WWR4_9BACT|nr:dihydroneopterin aldolase [Bacteroides caecigallinarum]MBU3837960.1 dihydroneopterin aldolase [Candidatus Phocaeicola faecigallinarum]MCF2582208.1 dihydroneopterin aldolase [Bacteroides caecigallinarum]